MERFNCFDIGFTGKMFQPITLSLSLSLSAAFKGLNFLISDTGLFLLKERTALMESYKQMGTKKQCPSS